MVDGGDQDDKVIAVATKDRFYRDYTSITQLPQHLTDEIRHFFCVYKALEGKVTEAKEMLDADAAVEMVKTCMDKFDNE